MWWLFHHRGHHCHACWEARRRRTQRLKAKNAEEWLIDPARQDERLDRGQHPLGVPAREKVLPWAMIIVGVLVWGLGLVTIPLGFALWLVAFLLIGEGMVIRQRRIEHADAYYERSASYEQRQAIDHWQ